MIPSGTASRRARRSLVSPPLRRVGLVVLVAAALGCAADEPTGVLVHVDAQRWGKVNAASLRVTVWSRDGAQVFQQDWSLVGDGAAELPIVVWMRGSSGATFLVDATLRDTSGLPIHSAWGTGTIEGNVLRRALLCVEDACRFSRCDAAVSCASDLGSCTRCDLGVCADPELETFSSESRPTCPGIGSSGTETVCWDDEDDDGDGAVRCDDSDCAGQACSELAHVCSGGECLCPTPGPEAECGNGLNDDCEPDGIDCADTDCEGQACGTHGRTCMAGECVCPGGEDFETSCGDGVDNDCDGAADCMDPDDCPDEGPCGPHGLVCRADACVCETGMTSESCTNGVDDDCDGGADCADPDECGDGTACGPNGLVCSGSSCVCGQPGVQTCGALTGDEDCDGLGGCDDPDCAGDGCWFNGEVCGGYGGRTPNMCTCGRPEFAGERTCSDDIDNDCDGAKDCVDNGNCNHEFCGPNRVCCGGACRDYSSTNHCGGCNADCATGSVCRAVSHSGRAGFVCGCGGGVRCPRGQTCRNYAGLGDRCSCDDNGDCGDNQVCVRRPDQPNFCAYPWM